MKFFLLYLIIFISAFGAQAQLVSNSGTEFWAVFPSHEPDYDTNFNILYANYSIFITSAQASSGTVTCGSFNQTFSVAANSVTEIKIPRANAYIDATEQGKVLAGRAIHILVDPDQPKVVVYAHIFAGQRSAASLILPKEALGKQYYSVNFNEKDTEGKNFIVLTAVQPGTRIRLQRFGIDLVPGGVYLPNVNDVYEYLSDDDLTGVSVSIDSSTDCNRFAMFTGTSGVKIGRYPCQPMSLDPLFQQGYPIESWGQNYGFVPFSMQSLHSKTPVRTAGQYIRVIAKDNNTNVSIDGTSVATLFAGQTYVSPQTLTKPAIITADKPVCVAQYALSQACGSLQAPADTASKDYSDPDMVILNPIEYAIKNITVYSSVRENIKEQYVNVLMKTDAASSFKVNGATPPATFQPVSTKPEYSYLQLNLSGYHNNTFTLTADKGFNAIAYGFGDVESYAYSAGTTLSGSQVVTGIHTADNQAIDSACVNDNFFFKLTLPYQATQITWKMDDAEAAVMQAAPTPTKVTVNQTIVYEYTFARSAAFQTAGVHHIKVNFDYANTGSCELGKQQIDYLFKVNGVTDLNINLKQENCANVFNFSATSSLPQSQINTWLWDFGDDLNPATNTDTSRAPTHSYSKAGTYTVTLITNLKNGCQSAVSKSVYIDPGLPLPVVVFDSLASVCISVVPYQLSAAKEQNGVAGKGVYSGRGVTVDGIFDPIAAGVGKHIITFTFTTLSGCQAVKSQPIDVLESPGVTGYTLYVIQGKSALIKPAYKGNNLTYTWAPVIGLSSNNIANPQVNADINTDYTITVNNGACSAQALIKVIILKPLVIPNTFTPNGDGVNDLWVIKNIELYPHPVVDVFNRYGALIFHSAGYAKLWDGRINGRELPAGVYYYTITPGAGLTPLSGPLMIIR